MKKLMMAIVVLQILHSTNIIAQKKKDNGPAPFKIEDKLVEDLKFRSIGPALNSGRISDFAVVPG